MTASAARVTFSDDAGTGRRIDGGVVAYNDELRVERAVRSLLSQELPQGVNWGRIWLVASGCTDRTVDIGQRLSVEDPRVHVVIEPERRGKASAIREVLRRASGESLVLLNSDAVAETGAVAALIRQAQGRLPPYAVMARPVVSDGFEGSWANSIRWMWGLHHAVHSEILADGTGAHLSDELLLLSLPSPVSLEAGVINDGSFLGVWLARNEGGCWYASESRVTIDVPRTVPDHLWQRRRIHVGNAQVRRLLGQGPTTLPRIFLQNPAQALRMIRQHVRSRSDLVHLARIAALEALSHGLAAWDRAPPARDHVRWRRIHTDDRRRTPETPSSRALEVPNPERRLEALLRVARAFDTGVPLDRLAELLPDPAPVSASGLAEWLDGRPMLARVREGRAFSPRAETSVESSRAARGRAYQAEAERLVAGPLAFLVPWTRCIGISGSAAYGEPEAGDDLDFFVVSRTGALWWSLALTYLALRLRRIIRGSPNVPEACFNYVLDDTLAPSAFQNGQGFLFARESLSVRSLRGDDYYRGVLAQAAWMRREIPRLYDARTQSPGDSRPAPVGWPIRSANAFVLPWLAFYLQLVGLRRNHRARRERRTRGTFRTITGIHRLAFVSHRFEEVRAKYAASPTEVTESEGLAPPSRIPASR